MTVKTRVFRTSFWGLWIGLTISWFIGCTILSVRGWMDGKPIIWELLLGLPVVLGVVLGTAVWLFPVYVSPAGLRCYNHFGFYRTVPWSSITRVRMQRIYNTAYLAVQSSRCWTDRYVPLDLSDMAGFEEAVRTCAGDAHPLTQALQGPGPGGSAATPGAAGG